MTDVFCVCGHTRFKRCHYNIITAIMYNSMSCYWCWKLEGYTYRELEGNRVDLFVLALCRKMMHMIDNDQPAGLISLALPFRKWKNRWFIFLIRDVIWRKRLTRAARERGHGFVSHFSRRDFNRGKHTVEDLNNKAHFWDVCECAWWWLWPSVSYYLVPSTGETKVPHDALCTACWHIHTAPRCLSPQREHLRGIVRTHNHRSPFYSKKFKCPVQKKYKLLLLVVLIIFIILETHIYNCIESDIQSTKNNLQTVKNEIPW